jgi:hypothetical protein
VQFTLLAEAVAADGPSMLDADAKLLDFMAEMDARLDCCVASLDQFGILAPDERPRVEAALAELRQAKSAISSAAPHYTLSLANWIHQAELEVEHWSNSDLMGAGAR